MNEDLKLIKRIRSNFETYAGRTLWIKTKVGEHRRLLFNSSQRYLDSKINEQLAQTGKVRVLVLKGRQQGISTYTEGRFYYHVTGGFGRKAFILTHEDKATKNLFSMASRYHEKMDLALKPSTKRDSATELYFDKLDSGYGVGTARTKGTGRSDMIQYFHGCLGMDTPIVDGETGKLRRLDSIKVGDLVRTHTGVAAPISFISRQTKQAYSVTFKGLGKFPLVSSGEHRFITKSGWRELKEINEGDYVGFPVTTITKADARLSFGVVTKARPQGGGSQAHEPTEIDASYSLGRIVGLYLAEGCIIKQWKSGEPSAVCFAVHEKEVGRTESWLDDIQDLFVSRSTLTRKDSKTVTVTAYGRSFANFVRGLCGELDGKQLPSAWARLGKEFVTGMVHGYLSGDGHFNAKDGDRRISATSIRSSLTIGMRDALAALGYGWACIDHKDAAIRHGRNEREAWTLRLCGSGVDQISKELGKPMPPRLRNGNYSSVEVSGGYAWIPIKSISPIGEVTVMDLEVDHEDHSYCTIHGASHNSEVAFWPNQDEHVAGILQALPNAPGTEAILETTANGKEMFYELWQEAERGMNQWRTIFIPWYWQDEYRIDNYPADFELTIEEREIKEAFNLDLAQMVWRRDKINTDFRGKEWIFQQEYPSFPSEAFNSSKAAGLIEDRFVIAARKGPRQVPFGPKIVGIDVARQGKDRSAAVFRQGRHVHWTRTYDVPDLMATAGWAARIYDEIKPDAMFIDESGGYGAAVVDRMRERGYNVIGIQFGGGAIEPNRYKNKRAEMWGEMNDWLREGGVSIPDEDDLHSDLTGPQEKRDSNDRLVLESKEDMMKRGVSSPDKGDALGLTFAQPVTSNVTKHVEDVMNRPAADWRAA